MLRHVFSVHTLLTVFIVNGCWVLSRVLLHPLRWLYDFYLSLFEWCATLIYFQILNYPCILGVNSAWSWYTLLLGIINFHLLIPCCGFLNLYSSWILICVSVCVCVCVCLCVCDIFAFCMRMMLAFRMSSTVLLTLWFLGWLRRIDINSVNVFLEYICETVLS